MNPTSPLARYMKRAGINEAAPKNKKAEDFIKGNKESFKKKYGDEWEKVLYATAHKKFGKNEEHGAGEEGTDALTQKYKKDTPGQYEAVNEEAKVVLNNSELKSHIINTICKVSRMLEDCYVEYESERSGTMVSSPDGYTKKREKLIKEQEKALKSLLDLTLTFKSNIKKTMDMIENSREQIMRNEEVDLGEEGNGRKLPDHLKKKPGTDVFGNPKKPMPRAKTTTATPPKNDGPLVRPKKNRSKFWKKEKTVGEEAVKIAKKFVAEIKTNEKEK